MPPDCGKAPPPSSTTAATSRVGAERGARLARQAPTATAAPTGVHMAPPSTLAEGPEEVALQEERRLALYRASHRPKARLVRGLLQPSPMYDTHHDLAVGAAAGASLGGHRRGSPPPLGVCPPPSTADVTLGAERERPLDFEATMRPGGGGSRGGAWPSTYAIDHGADDDSFPAINPTPSRASTAASGARRDLGAEPELMPASRRGTRAPAAAGAGACASL